MASHASVLAWEISWTEEPGGQQSWGHEESDTTEQMEKGKDQGMEGEGETAGD